MKKIVLVVSLFTSSLCMDVVYAHNSLEMLSVIGGAGTLQVESLDKATLTITIKDVDGKLILSETIHSETGKLQLLGLSSGTYEVEIKNKKESKFFTVDVK